MATAHHGFFDISVIHPMEALALQMQIIGNNPMRSFNTSRTFLLALLLVSVAGRCAAQALVSQVGGPSPMSGNTSTTHKPAPRASQYTVGVADVLHVSVWKNPELSQTVTVGPDGFVSLALIGDIHVAGSTTSELGDLLTSRLGAYMLTPQVTVSVVEIRSRQVYVLGQVGKPGGYPLIGQMSVIQMLAQAGGLNTFAKRGSIYVLRPNKGTVEKIAYHYTDVLRGKGAQNFDLQPGDTVVVP
jgi:polysaccharide export outer membrane protein